ncbi:MAG: hypothetical protein ABIZ91_17265 [Gemmatimonadaceae bacterium]
MASSAGPPNRMVPLRERLGLTLVGERTESIVRGDAECLLRTSRGPLADYPAARPAPPSAADTAPGAR